MISFKYLSLRTHVQALQSTSFPLSPCLVHPRALNMVCVVSVITGMGGYDLCLDVHVTSTTIKSGQSI